MRCQNFDHLLLTEILYACTTQEVVRALASGPPRDSDHSLQIEMTLPNFKTTLIKNQKNIGQKVFTLYSPFQLPKLEVAGVKKHLISYAKYLTQKALLHSFLLKSYGHSHILVFEN